MQDRFKKKAVPPRIDVPKHIFELSSPYNWDFRAIPASLLKDAIGAEYLRSWAEFRAAAIKWFESKIDGRLIRDHVIEAASKNQMFPHKVWEALPKRWYYEFHVLEHDCAYPVPFAWLLEKGFIRERPKPDKSISFPVCPGITLHLTEKELKALFGRLVNIHPMNKDRAKFVTKMLSFPEVGESYGYHLEINFDRHRNEDLVKAFAFWVAQEAKKRRKIAVHGRASAAKWHRLKQLAAKRLSDAGLNFKDAMRMISEREKAVPFPDYNRVLPKYNSPGAWHDAIKEANLMVEKMKRNFHFEDWELL